MTEDEAKTKICHVTIAAFQPDRTIEGFTTFQGQGCNCIGSECMAWRGQGEVFMVEFNGKPEEKWAWNPAKHVEERAGDSYYKTAKVRVLKKGFCGLAGKP